MSWEHWDQARWLSKDVLHRKGRARSRKLGWMFLLYQDTLPAAVTHTSGSCKSKQLPLPPPSLWGLQSLSGFISGGSFKGVALHNWKSTCSTKLGDPTLNPFSSVDIQSHLSTEHTDAGGGRYSCPELGYQRHSPLPKLIFLPGSFKLCIPTNGITKYEGQGISDNWKIFLF